MKNHLPPRLAILLLALLFGTLGLSIARPALAAGSVLLDGFESQDFSRWTSVVGSPLVQTSFVHGGSFAARVSVAGQPGYLSKILSTPTNELYARLWFQVRTRSTPMSLFRYVRSDKPVLGVGLQADGRVFLRNSIAGTTEVSSATVSDTAWHVLELHILASGSNGHGDVWLDGAKLGDVGGIEALGTLPVTELRLGEDVKARTEDVVLDDVRVATSFISVPDIGSPSKPSDLAADAPSSDHVDLSWTGSNDNVGVTGYTIYRDGAPIDTTAGTTYTDSTVAASSPYDYTVDAFDAAGNHSDESDPAHVDVPDPDLIPPDPPANLLGAPISPIRVDLSWNASPSADVTGYTIYRDGAPIDTTSSTAYSDNTVSPGSSYDYTADAVDAAHNHSSPTDPPTHVDVPEDSSPPDPPTGLSAEVISSHRVDLTWNVPNDDVGVTGYTIYRDGTPIDTSTGPSYSDTNVQATHSYVYTVDAHDAAGHTSTQSDPANADVPDDSVPSTPTGLVAGPVTFDRVDLTWDPSIDDVGVAGYTVYRDGAFLDTMTAASYSDDTVDPSKTYRYRVDAFDAAGNHSPKSASARANTPDPPDTAPPSIPQNLHTVTVTQTRVELDWSSSTDDTGVEGYEVFRDGGVIDTTTSSAYTDTSVAPGATYRYKVDAFDAVPNTSDPSSTIIVDVPQSGGGDPVIAAAGDIASSGSGDTATANVLAQIDPTATLALGDNAYDNGTPTEYHNYYDPTWGAFKSTTYPTPGNHEYGFDSHASGYFGYFGSRAPASYYSFDIGDWHLISLDSECGYVSCSNNSTQETWLAHDLASHSANCTLAFWHEPRYGPVSGQDTNGVDALWDDLVAAHADLVLSGHVHTYARFTPLNASGQPSATGVREFIVGTGGKSVSAPPSGRSILEKGGGSFGVLKLTLHSNSYDWQFVHVASQSFTDSGTSSCH